MRLCSFISSVEKAVFGCAYNTIVCVAGSNVFLYNNTMK